MPKSITTHQSSAQQHRHFTDREKERDILKRLINARNISIPVVMFYGVGGAGKSWLLGKLKQELADELPSLPTALLDLDLRSGETNRTDVALAKIRRQFKDVICPRFDLAFAWLRHMEGYTEEPLLKGSGPAADAFELVKAVAGSAVGVPGVGHGVKKLGDYFKKHIFKDSRLEKWVSKMTGQEEFQELRSADPQQLYRELADRLMDDLAKNLEPRGERTCRAVIFLDTFEFLGLGLPGRAQRHDREGWVRDLHKTGSPVLLVLAGRDRLVWDECDPDYADEKYLEQHLIGGLSEPDSRAYLGKCGITDQQLQDAILRTSVDTESPPGGAERGYHPFSLGLCADAVLSDLAAGRAVDPATFDMLSGDVARMAQRFMKSLPDHAHEVWVRRLGLTPRFDEVAGRAAFSPVRGAAQEAAWNALRGYSFVQETDESEWWTLHAKMRDVLADAPMATDDHRIWRDHWQARSRSETDKAASLAWFHGWCVDPMGGMRDWKTLARRLRHQTRMAEHLGVVDWWEPTGLFRRVPTSRDEVEMLNTIGIEIFYSSLGDRSENLRKAMGCHEAALRLATETAFPEEWAESQTNLGNVYQFKLGGNREQNLGEAFKCYQNALRVRTKTAFPQEWARTQNCIGWAYYCLLGGDRGENLREAIKCYHQAQEVCTPTTLPQDWAMTQTNLGVAYASLPGGDRGENLRRAIECYESVLPIYTEAAARRRWATTQDCLGTGHRKLASVEDQAENLQKAIGYYEAALRGRTEAEFPEEWAETNYNLGLGLADLAEAVSERARLTAALAAFENAERGYVAVGNTSDAEAVRKEAAKVRVLLAEVAQPPGSSPTRP